MTCYKEYVAMLHRPVSVKFFIYQDAKRTMKTQNEVDSSKKAKNIAAVFYLLVLTFLVGGSYIHQHRGDDSLPSANSEAAVKAKM